MVKHPPCKVGDAGPILSQAIKTPHAAEQLSPHATTPELLCPSPQAPQQERLRDSAKTREGQIKTNKKKRSSRAGHSGYLHLEALPALVRPGLALLSLASPAPSPPPSQAPARSLALCPSALGCGSRQHAYPSRAGAPGHRVGTSLNRAAFSYLPWTTGLEEGQMPSDLR